MQRFDRVLWGRIEVTLILFIWHRLCALSTIIFAFLINRGNALVHKQSLIALIVDTFLIILAMLMKIYSPAQASRRIVLFIVTLD